MTTLTTKTFSAFPNDMLRGYWFSFQNDEWVHDWCSKSPNHHHDWIEHSEPLYTSDHIYSQPMFIRDKHGNPVVYERWNLRCKHCGAKKKYPAD